MDDERCRVTWRSSHVAGLHVAASGPAPPAPARRPGHRRDQPADRLRQGGPARSRPTTGSAYHRRGYALISVVGTAVHLPRPVRRPALAPRRGRPATVVGTATAAMSRAGIGPGARQGRRRVRRGAAAVVPVVAGIDRGDGWPPPGQGGGPGLAAETFLPWILGDELWTACPSHPPRAGRPRAGARGRDGRPPWRAAWTAGGLSQCRCWSATAPGAKHRTSRGPRG